MNSELPTVPLLGPAGPTRCSWKEDGWHDPRKMQHCFWVPVLKGFCHIIIVVLWYIEEVEAGVTNVLVTFSLFLKFTQQRFFFFEYALCAGKCLIWWMSFDYKKRESVVTIQGLLSDRAWAWVHIQHHTNLHATSVRHSHPRSQWGQASPGAGRSVVREQN